MTGTAKQKLILAETAASHVSLHDYFDLHKADTANITKLLASVRRHTKPVSISAGITSIEGWKRLAATRGTFTYNQTPGDDRICLRHSP